MEELSEIPRSRNDRSLSVHAVRLRHMIKEGRTTQVTVFVDVEEGEEDDESDREPRRSLGRRSLGRSSDGRRGSNIGLQIIQQAAALQAAGSFPGSLSGSLLNDPSIAASLSGISNSGAAGRRASVRKSVVLTTAQRNHVQTLAEKEMEAQDELKELIKARDAKKRLSVIQKADRERTRIDPEFGASHRRSLLILKPGEHEVAEKIAVIGPIQLRTKKSMVTMFRRMPKLDRPDDEQVSPQTRRPRVPLRTLKRVHIHTLSHITHCHTCTHLHACTHQHSPSRPLPPPPCSDAFVPLTHTPLRTRRPTSTAAPTCTT